MHIHAQQYEEELLLELTDNIYPHIINIIKYPSAIIAWNNTPKKYKNKDASLAPIGAVHYYRGGKYGHIVIQSELKNKTWGTDLPTTNKIGLHHYRLPVNKWRYQYLGWASWLNGHELPLKELPE